MLGPTGTGKSNLALDLAHHLGGEIVGCDALQVYRGFDAGTAKPTAADRRRIPHHLVDCVDPHRDGSMAAFVRQAERAISGIAARGRVPLVVGGTGLYLRALLRGVVPAPDRDPALRKRLQRIAERRGSQSLHRWLSRADPPSAARLKPRDTQRLVRALELALTGELTWSERLRSEGTWADGRERYDALKIGLDMGRPALATRLDARVDRFFDAGLVDEVRGLLEAGVPREANAFKAIGYREILAAIDRGEDPELQRDAVKRHTRRYAKRQRTWFRSEPAVVWLDAAADRRFLLERAAELWRQRGFAAGA